MLLFCWGLVAKFISYFICLNILYQIKLDLLNVLLFVSVHCHIQPVVLKFKYFIALLSLSLLKITHAGNMSFFSCVFYLLIIRLSVTAETAEVFMASKTESQASDQTPSLDEVPTKPAGRRSRRQVAAVLGRRERREQKGKG